MIRRWSYLIKPAPSNQFKGKLHRYAFKLVRRVTRFKRFIFGVTKFKRRGWFRLKSRQAWFKLHVAIVGGLELRKQIQSLHRCQFYRFIMPLEKDVFIGTWYRMTRGIGFNVNPISFLSLRIRKTICIIYMASVRFKSRQNHHELWYPIPSDPTKIFSKPAEGAKREIAFTNTSDQDFEWDSEIRELNQLVIFYQMFLLRDTYALLNLCLISLRP